jgi:diguanylate cyclase (GGDEF)-like protein/PAS domain S-box-containing protein
MLVGLLVDDSLVTQFEYTPYVIPLALSAAVIVAVLVVTWRNRDAEVAPWFAASLIALLVWTVGYILELMAVGVSAKVFWADLQYVGTTTLPLLWLEVVLIYTGRGPLPAAAKAALWTVCVAIILTVFANPAHLIRGHAAVVTHGSLSALDPDYGVLWRYAWLPWAYSLFVVIVVVLARGMLRARRIHARQYAAMLVATAVPLVAGSLYTFGVSPWPDYNPAMAVVSVSGVLMAYALFHFRLFDIAPLARDAVIDELADGLIVIDLENRLCDFNAAARQVFPKLSDDAVGRPVDEVLAIHPAMLEGLRREVGPAVGAQRAPGEGLVRADVSIALPGDEGGTQRDFTLHLTPVRSRCGEVVGHALLLHDVSESVELRERLEHLASRDELTGLLSRKAWQEEAEHELMRARRYRYGLSVALLDLDQLALVNDVCGQAAGDELLRSAAAACRRVLRPFDIVGRVGSDEIAMLLPHLTPAEAAAVGRGLRDAVGALQATCNSEVLCISVCVGVAAVEHLTDEMLSGLMHEVEGALLLAKQKGRGRVMCAWEA